MIIKFVPRKTTKKVIDVKTPTHKAKIFQLTNVCRTVDEALDEVFYQCEQLSNKQGGVCIGDIFATIILENGRYAEYTLENISKSRDEASIGVIVRLFPSNQEAMKWNIPSGKIISQTCAFGFDENTLENATIAIFEKNKFNNRRQ